MLLKIIAVYLAIVKLALRFTSCWIGFIEQALPRGKAKDALSTANATIQEVISILDRSWFKASRENCED